MILKTNRFLVSLLITTLVFIQGLQAFPNKKIAAPQTIRVLLESYDLKNRSLFTISSKEGMFLYNPEHPEKKGLYPHKTIKIAVEKNKISVQDDHENFRSLKANKITFAPREKYLTLNGHAYQGIMTLMLDTQEKKVLIINQLNLDDYVCAVLLSESLQGWPDKMQEIQAIISRTYALYQIQQTKIVLKNKTQRPYDLKNSNVHQTYTGAHNYDNLHRAVTKTAGMILTHHHNLICAMFDICCGGVVPALIHNPSANFRAAPYLARHQSCTYCKNYKLYRWEYKISLSELLNTVLKIPDLSPKIKLIGKLTDLHITKKDKAGVAQRVKLIGKRNNYGMSARYLKTALGSKIKSYAFSSKTEGNNVIIMGKGHGHHLGVCQYGAREMVKRNWSLKDIFGFYYPGAKLAQI